MKRARAALVAALAVLVAVAFLVVMFKKASRVETLAGRALLPVGSACQYSQRVRRNGQWACPAGSVDTGRTWGDPDGDKQCVLGCVTNAGVCQYRYREKQGDGSWRCPAGWADTGLNNGVPEGERQCQQCPVRGDCRYTTRVQTPTGQWRCPEGSLDTGRDWNMGADGEKQCLTACCPSGFKGKNGGSSDLFPCGPWDIQRDGGIRRSTDGQKATELMGACCQWTNKDCRQRGLAGLWQNRKDQGITKTGYYTADDGCEVNIYDQRGGPLAVTGSGLGIKGLGIQVGLALAVTAISVGAAAFMGPAAGVLAGGVGGAAMKLVANQAAKKVTKTVADKTAGSQKDKAEKKLNKK